MHLTMWQLIARCNKAVLKPTSILNLTNNETKSIPQGLLVLQ